MGSLKNIFVKLLLILVGGIISLVAIEIVLRISLPQETSLKFYDNPVFGSALIPNQKGEFVTETKEYSSEVQVNSHGWPDIEHSFEKPEGVYRILVLGDSFVENFQVQFEKRFFRQLQDKLGDKFEIIAMGRGNTGTAQEYLMFKEYGLKYKPDLVIQMFLTANDVKNNSPVLQNDPYLPYFETDGSGNLKEIRQLRRSERKLSSLKTTLNKFRLIKTILSFRQKYLEEKAAANLGGYPVDYHIYDSNYSDEYKKAWDITKKLIIETRKITEDARAKYLLISLANNEQVNSKVQEEIFNKYPNFKYSNPDFKKPDNILKGFCNEQNIDCLFMLPYFQNYLSKNPFQTTHFFYDGHWNEKGTNLATEFILSNLKNYLTIK